MIAEATKTAVAVLVAGKFETTGLLASVAIQNKSFVFLRPLRHKNE